MMYLSLFKDSTENLIEENRYSSKVEVCRENLKKEIQSSMTMGHKMTVSTNSVNNFVELLATTIEASLRESKSVETHCTDIRNTMSELETKGELAFACGWRPVKSIIERAIRDLS